MVKYLGSKRRLVPELGSLAALSGACTALDMFTGTTRVARQWKRQAIHVTALDSARYSEVFAASAIATDADQVDVPELGRALEHLGGLPGQPGYFTETFCHRSRFVQPFNGERIDAIRNEIASEFSSHPLEPLLLTSLVEAADRVDSTTGLQMAYLKQWAKRSYNPLQLRVPELIAGPGKAIRGDACRLAADLGEFDIAYLDPPYNQHRYNANYHVWETLIAWDAPDHYGVACKRIDTRDPSTKSPFNQRRTMPGALRQVINDVRCRVLVLSYNDEAWLTLADLEEMCSGHQEVKTLSFDSRRYVGAQIGIFSPSGTRVGQVSHLRNREYIVVAGPSEEVRRMVGNRQPACAPL